MVLLIALWLASVQLFPEEINEENVINVIEYSSHENDKKIFGDLMGFLSPKWNLDKKYASQVLGYLYGYIDSNKIESDCIENPGMEINNFRLKKYIDLMISNNEYEIYKQLVADKYSTLEFAWFYYFGSHDVNFMKKIIDLYSESEAPDDVSVLTFRYYYERHNEIADMVKDNESLFFEEVRKKTYKEWQNALHEKLLSLKK